MVMALAAPVIITVIGIVIAAFIISIFMPILQLSSLVSV
jgi:type II secretory pathway component PulF